MEEAKAAAYYDELTRKGEGAARFKQGLGFSSSTSSSSPFPPKPSFSNFVRASSPGKADKQAQLESIQSKLRRPRRSLSPGCRPPELRREKDGRARRRSSSRESRIERDRERKSSSTEMRRRSRSYSDEEDERSGNGMRERESSRRRGSRSRSPSWVSRGRDRSGNRRREKRSPSHRSSNDTSYKVDYARVIEGYSQMIPAERVKAKMKLQLSQTAAKDSNMRMSSGWERFDFNKDAPLDDDDNEIEVAEDDASLVKEIGRSFRFSAVQAKREEEIKAAHDEAMFGASAVTPTFPESESIEGPDSEEGKIEKHDNNVLISDKVLELQQGSWRHRAWRFKS